MILYLYIASVCVVWYIWTARWKSRRLPPGPAPWPLVGNIQDLPPHGHAEWQHWLKHKDLYGPISSISVLGTTIVLIHSAEVAFELLDKRSGNYSSRPRMVFGGEMCGWVNVTIAVPYGDKLRSQRRQIHSAIGTKSSLARFNALQEDEVHKFLVRMLKDPERFEKHCKDATGAIILKLTYGYSVDTQNLDPLVDLAERASTQFSAASVSGAWAVDIIPTLKYLPGWLPGTKFKQLGREWHQTLTQMVNLPYQFVRSQMSQSAYEPSVVSSLLEQSSEIQREGDEDEIKWSAISLYAAGTDTTAKTIITFILAMLTNPNIQEEARAEIERVVGADRLPTFNDRPHLPYIEAVVKEAFRWHTVAPLGMPHATIANDEYNGYFIPKGALIVPNIWWFTHDPEVYPDPMAFNPHRYLQPTPARDPRDFIFGFGRRACPGKLFADASVWLNIACILAVFDITKPISEKGDIIEPEVKFSPGILSHALPFSATIKARSNRHDALIRNLVVGDGKEDGHAQKIKAMMTT